MRRSRHRYLTNTRTVSDGNQVLYEIRRPMASAETETGVVPDGTPHPHQYGRVGYTHGGGLDKPLAIYRMDYDAMFPAAQLLAPHTDARGAYEAGTHSVTGMSMPCRTMPRVVVEATPYPSDDPENPPSPHADSVQVCVKVDFPAAKQWMTYSPRNTSQLGAYAWWGSLISGSRDASGQMYMRNRYYDPSSGRFTQEDPIGLAGGMNLYGFAGGDPVNFSDPYGLRVVWGGETQQDRDRARNLWNNLARVVNSRRNSQDPAIAESARYLAAMMNEMYHDQIYTYVITINNSPNFVGPTGGGQERESLDSDNERDIQVADEDSEYISIEPWMLLAHELGGAQNTVRGWWRQHGRAAVRAENHARRLAGCRQMRNRWHAGDTDERQNPTCKPGRR